MYYGCLKWIEYTGFFAEGIVENSSVVCSRVCENLDYLGIEIDMVENDKNASIISTEKSKVKVFVIPTDEDIMIAKAKRDFYINAQKKTY